MNKVAFIVNGLLFCREDIIRKIKDVFSELHQVDFKITASQGHAVQLVAEVLQQGFTYIICVGGDGSLNEVVNGVMSLKNKLPPAEWIKIRVGLLPYGTGNDFARTMHISKDIKALKSWIDADKFTLTDLGFATFQSTESRSMQRYFINITDVGMGGVIAKKLQSYSKWMGSTLTYQRAILSTFLTYRHQPVRVTVASEERMYNIMSVVMANGRYFGGGLGIAPDANIANNRIALVILGEISLLDYIKYLGTIKKSKKINHPQVSYSLVEDIVINTDKHPLPIDMDGEFIGYTPLKIEIKPAQIAFLCDVVQP